MLESLVSENELYKVAEMYFQQPQGVTLGSA